MVARLNQASDIILKYSVFIRGYIYVCGCIIFMFLFVFFYNHKEVSTVIRFITFPIYLFDASYTELNVIIIFVMIDDNFGENQVWKYIPKFTLHQSQNVLIAKEI